MRTLIAIAVVALAFLAGALFFAVSVGPSGRGGCTDSLKATGRASCYDPSHHLND